MHPAQGGKGPPTLILTVALLVLPTFAGVYVNSIMGWWPGFLTFLTVALVVGRIAYRAGRDRR